MATHCSLHGHLPDFRHTDTVTVNNRSTCQGLKDGPVLLASPDASQGASVCFSQGQCMASVLPRPSGANALAVGSRAGLRVCSSLIPSAFLKWTRHLGVSAAAPHSAWVALTSCPPRPATLAGPVRDLQGSSRSCFLQTDRSGAFVPANSAVEGGSPPRCALERFQRHGRLCLGHAPLALSRVPSGCPLPAAGSESVAHCEGFSASLSRPLACPKVIHLGQVALALAVGAQQSHPVWPTTHGGRAGPAAPPHRGRLF